MAKRLFVLYGSETGNCEGIAKEIHELGHSNGYDIVLGVLNDYKKLGLLKEPSLAVIVVSTTGNGDPPQNAERFFRTVRRRGTPKDTFNGLTYVFLFFGILITLIVVAICCWLWVIPIMTNSAMPAK